MSKVIRIDTETQNEIENYRSKMLEKLEPTTNAYTEIKLFYADDKNVIKAALKNAIKK